MEFPEPSRRPRAESILPMINVVFLLLIFFLMTSRLAQPHPLEVAPHEAAAGQDAAAGPVLFAAKDGRLHYGGIDGQGAIARLAAEHKAAEVVRMRADAALEATALARILRDLSAAGLRRVELVVERK